MRVWWGAVAQLGERLVRNEEVSGSIPLSSTNNNDLIQHIEVTQRPILMGKALLRLPL